MSMSTMLELSQVQKRNGSQIILHQASSHMTLILELLLERYYTQESGDIALINQRMWEKNNLAILLWVVQM